MRQTRADALRQSGRNIGAPQGLNDDLHSILRHPVRQRLHLCIPAARRAGANQCAAVFFQTEDRPDVQNRPTDWRTMLNLPLFRKDSMSSTEKAMPVFSRCFFTCATISSKG